MSLWGSDTVRDVAESIGILNLNKDVTQALCRDVEYRISQILEEALKFMRHAKRTTLWSQDISQALRVLDVEPLYGYESTRPLKYGEASLGPGQPLFYVEDEEMDFEKLINAPLPKVPREMSFTAHWLAVEGVQPTIPQNPVAADSRSLELLPKGPNANPALAASADLPSTASTTTKPQVKHILSKELQLYFEKVCSAVLDESEEGYRTAGLASLKDDPGLSQLVPYFVQFVSEKVTHGLGDLFVLRQCLNMIEALTRNKNLNMAPYVASLIPPVLTCLIGRQLGSNLGTLDHFDVRDLARSVMKSMCDKYAKYSHSLKPRLARSCFKSWMDPRKSAGTHYGSILGMEAVGGAEVVMALILPRLAGFEEVLQMGMAAEEGPKRAETEKVIEAIINVLGTLVGYVPGSNADVGIVNGHAEEVMNTLRQPLVEKVGEIVATRIADSENGLPLAKAVLEAQQR